jgi:patatin-like phospholipase/acyl hydrolase
MKKKVCILSIDGGGIRELIPAMILEYIEKQLQEISEAYHLSDFFDFIVGSDFGGVLAALYVTPGKHGRPAYLAGKGVEVFRRHGAEIFDISLLKKIRSIGGMTDEKYSAKKLEALLQDLMGDYRLGDTVKPLMLMAYDVRNRRSNYYTTTDARDPIRNFYLRDLCRAGTAIPSYFETARIVSETKTPFSLISGSIFAANPAMAAYAESRKINFAEMLDQSDKPVFPTAGEILMLSIGTGDVRTPYYYDSIKDWGDMNWLKPIIDISYSSNSEAVDYQMRKIFDATESPEDYFRFNPQLVGKSGEIDDASEDNIRNLAAITEQYIEVHKEDFSRLIDKLINNNREE